MRVGFIGSGAWGITLANLIAKNNHEVLLHSIQENVIKSLESGNGHPKFPDFQVNRSIKYTADLTDLLDKDVIVESVTASGLRCVCKQLKKLGLTNKPFIVTSKGVEQESGLLLPQVAFEELGNEDLIGYMGGPTLASEVMMQIHTAAVASSTSKEIMSIIKQLFCSPRFRITFNSDIIGVALGGSIKNIIAIATGLSDGFGYGLNTKAILITRGLDELSKIAEAKGANKETIFGLSGLGDLIATGMSGSSRNFTFGKLIGKGMTREEAKEQIGMVVEGEYTVLSTYNLGKELKIDLPITNAMYGIIYENKDPKETLHLLVEAEIVCECNYTQMNSKVGF